MPSATIVREILSSPKDGRVPSSSAIGGKKSRTTPDGDSMNRRQACCPGGRGLTVTRHLDNVQPALQGRWGGSLAER